MVAVPMWRKDQSPAITSPLGGKCREAGRVTCQQEGRRAICSSHLSLVLPNGNGQAQKGMFAKQATCCCPALLGATRAPKWPIYTWSFLSQEASCRCSATTTWETDGTLRGTVQSTKCTESKPALGAVCSFWNYTQSWAGRRMVKLSPEYGSSAQKSFPSLLLCLSL